jgi:hypothetical protein
VSTDKIIPACTYFVGQKLIVFNSIEWAKKGDLKTEYPFWQEAKVINIRYQGEWLLDVKFDNGTISSGHYASSVRFK